MKPRRPPEPTADPSHALQAGPVIECWSPVRRDWREAQLRYRAARRAWMDEHGVVGPALAGTPWSFTFLLAEHGPERLADALVSRGLPRDWQPKPVPPPETARSQPRLARQCAP